MIKKEDLEKRLEDAKKAKEKLIAEANQLQGIIQDCKYWISELEKPKESKTKTK